LLPALESHSRKKCGVDFGRCYNQFIALGSVIRDMLNPEMILIGESDARSGDIPEQLYTGVCDSNPRIQRMNSVIGSDQAMSGEDERNYKWGDNSGKSARLGRPGTRRTTGLTAYRTAAATDGASSGESASSRGGGNATNDCHRSHGYTGSHSRTGSGCTGSGCTGSAGASSTGCGPTSDCGGNHRG
jgi:hypothetical protein